MKCAAPDCLNEVTSKVKTVRYCCVLCARRHAPRKRSGPLPTVRITKNCVSCGVEFVTRWARVRTCSKSCAMRLRAKLHGPSNWKGGVNKHGSGYLKELAKGHPAADKAGYVMQHRLVMERQLGRFLGKDEHVHHKNGKRDDNRPENLELWSGHKDPPGQRTVDLAYDLVTKLSDTERNELIRRLQ